MGLVTAEDFKRKRVELEQAAKEAETAKLKAQEKERKKKGKERQQQMKSLSFAVDDEEEAFVPPPQPKRKEAPTTADGTGAAAAAATDASTAAAASAPSVVAALSSSSSAQPSKKLKLSNKDPTADTSFLPDREREPEEAALRAKLESEWKAQQEETKKENIQIVFSYWDGSGHRNKVVVNKGATIGQFLEKARKGMCVHLLLFTLARGLPVLGGWVGERVAVLCNPCCADALASFLALCARLSSPSQCGRVPRASRTGQRQFDVHQGGFDHPPPLQFLRPDRDEGAREIGAPLPLRRARRRPHDHRCKPRESEQ